MIIDEDRIVRFPNPLDIGSDFWSQVGTLSRTEAYLWHRAPLGIGILSAVDVSIAAPIPSLAGAPVTSPTTWVLQFYVPASSVSLMPWTNPAQVYIHVDSETCLKMYQDEEDCTDQEAQIFRSKQMLRKRKYIFEQGDLSNSWKRVKQVYSPFQQRSSSLLDGARQTVQRVRRGGRVMYLCFTQTNVEPHFTLKSSQLYFHHWVKQALCCLI